MQESKKAIIITIIALLVFAGLIFFVQQKRAEKAGLQKGTEMATPTSEVKAPSAVPEQVGAGKVGETEKTIKGEEVVVLPPETGGPPRVLPPAIFNESGRIKEIKKDSIIITGTGYNFADQKPRDLTLKYTDSTKTKTQDKTKTWVGFEGLKNLKVGENITFESPENIRGKTEFEVSYVNKL